MGTPLWMLSPWAIFALAAGLKFWRLTSLFSKHLITAGATDSLWQDHGASSMLGRSNAYEAPP